MKKLNLCRKVISNLTQIKGGAVMVEADLNTDLKNCTALTQNRLTCETGLHYTCDHSYRICPVENKLVKNY